MQTEGSHARISNSPEYMPVVIEKTGILPGYGEIVSVAHYSLQNGDLMADPEMEFTIVCGDYYPISFRNDYLGRNDYVFGEDGINLTLQADLTTFANQWMQNIAIQQNITLTLPDNQLGR